MGGSHWRHDGVRRREQIVEAIESYWEEHGYGPSRLEIAEGVAMNERTVSKHIAFLLKEGTLVEDGRRRRTLRVMF